MLTVLTSARADAPTQIVFICDDMPYSKYGDVLREAFPSYEVASYDADFFARLRPGTAVEAFDTQAIPAAQAGIVSYWYPQYLAMVVIAVNRDRTAAKIGGWFDLLTSNEKIGMTDIIPYNGHILASIAYGMDGEDLLVAVIKCTKVAVKKCTEVASRKR